MYLDSQGSLPNVRPGNFWLIKGPEIAITVCDAAADYRLRLYSYVSGVGTNV